MASVQVRRMDGTEAGALDLNPTVFDAPLNPALVHEVAVALLAARRQGNAETKTRAYVSGGGIKPYRQKGTGNARHGSSREPQMRGGGSVWGPHKRSYRKKVTSRSRRQAVCCVLSERVRSGRLCVLEDLRFEEPKTKPFVEMLNRLAPEARKTLFVTAENDPNVLLSSRNLQGVRICNAADLNAVDVLNARDVVIVKDALPKLEARLAGDKTRSSDEKEAAQ